MTVRQRIAGLAYAVADTALAPLEAVALSRLAARTGTYTGAGTGEGDGEGDGDRKGGGTGDADWLNEYPPVFVIGPPRSGTTLALQALLAQWRFAYIPNLAARLPQTLVVATWLADRSKFGGESPIGAREKAGRPIRDAIGSDIGRPLSDAIESDVRRTSGFAIDSELNRTTGTTFASDLGRTSGAWGPHEAGRFWNRWLPRWPHPYVEPGATPEVDLQAMRRQVAGMSRLFQAPFLNKNVVNSMRIAPLLEAFPSAVFVHVHRDPLDTARSILRAREQAGGSRHLWWSVRPPEIEDIRRLLPCAQVVDQVYFVESRIEADRVRLGDERFHRLGYAELCDDPGAALDGVERFLRRRGLRLEERATLVPPRFEPRPTRPLDDDDERCLRERVALRWGGL